MKCERDEQCGCDDGREHVALDVRARGQLADDDTGEREQQEADGGRDLGLCDARTSQEHGERRRRGRARRSECRATSGCGTPRRRPPGAGTRRTPEPTPGRSPSRTPPCTCAPPASAAPRRRAARAARAAPRARLDPGAAHPPADPRRARSGGRRRRRSSGRPSPRPARAPARRPRGAGERRLRGADDRAPLRPRSRRRAHTAVLPTRRVRRHSQGGRARRRGRTRRSSSAPRPRRGTCRRGGSRGRRGREARSRCRRGGRARYA